MTRSLWRYSHFILALTSSLFLLIATLTGAILAVEPIAHQAKGYAASNLEEVPLAQTLRILKENYEEVFTLEVEPSGFVKTSVLNANFESLDLYIDPLTGESLGKVAPRSSIYQFATTLHRSLFLKGLGRFFVGLVSLLLCLIAISGILLLAQRQGGFKQFFSKVRDRNFAQRYHVILSRWFILPIIIIATTGVYLSAEKFSLLPDTKTVKTQIKSPDFKVIYDHISDIPLFQELKLADVRKVDFPFSTDPEEYYNIALEDQEIEVNQQTGAVISRRDYPFVTLATRFSLLTHTGTGSVLWSVILLLSSLSILFFMYSGFAISLKNRKKGFSIKKMPPKEDCEYIILVGSEMGTTFTFAHQLYNALSACGKKTFLAPLNAYTTFKNAKKIFILTATYGKGDATTNARKFTQLLPKIAQNQVDFAVLGFGSTQYPDYCKFAVDIDYLLQQQPSFKQCLKLHKINEQSAESFQSWVHALADVLGIPLQIKHQKTAKKVEKQRHFEVIRRSELNVDDTFLLWLKPKKKAKYQSGDLLAIVPPGQQLARQYSIAKVDKNIVLSVKKHEQGICSPYLSSLWKGDKLKASIQQNIHFHLPKNNSPVFMVANGTGIAPFLGMLSSRKNRNSILLWGTRTKSSSELYRTLLEKHLATNKNLTFEKCYSREGNKTYVQDLVLQNQERLITTFEKGGTLMLCGSLAMQRDVLSTVEQLLQKANKPALSYYEEKDQVKLDCY
ncbi:PepSY domain-containing protein [Flavimarina sp. Hel_I_48]|uniref:PepSY domain-containing protein n=1 Tax=Flavimarina sp. Hel_I_48 TaxID=1392488 RepID=UPI0004DF1F62|nr:PepSY domain-containing protein [Flavimarina sp. Hel_I_48]